MPFSLRTRLSPIWQNRDFWRYWVADAISELGSSLSYFALPIVAAVTLGVTPGQMGLMRALGNIRSSSSGSSPACESIASPVSGC